MGYNIPGHGSCLICHPDLDKRWRKAGWAKGLKNFSRSVAAQMQESERLFDLLAQADAESVGYDE